MACGAILHTAKKEGVRTLVRSLNLDGLSTKGLGLALLKLRPGGPRMARQGFYLLREI